VKKSIMVTLVLLIALSFSAFAATPLGSTEHPKMKTLSQESPSPNAIGNINAGATTKDVTKLANVSAIFGTKEVIIDIDGVNAIGDEWIEISDQGAASGNLTGWTLHNQENLTYTFPVFTIDAGSKFKVHGGMGTNNKTDLFANTTTPLVNDKADEITLLDVSGAIVSKYNFNASAPVPTTSTRSPEKLPVLLNDNSPRSPEKAPLLINDTTPRSPEKAPLLVNSSA
jgi:hypothetical protein